MWERGTNLWLALISWEIVKIHASVLKYGGKLWPLVKFVQSFCAICCFISQIYVCNDREQISGTQNLIVTVLGLYIHDWSIVASYGSGGGGAITVDMIVLVSHDDRRAHYDYGSSSIRLGGFLGNSKKHRCQRACYVSRARLQLLAHPQPTARAIILVKVTEIRWTSP